MILNRINMHKIIFRLLFSVFFITCGISSYSQDILKGKDLSKVKVDQLSDAEILKYQQQLKGSGISEAEAEQIAVAKGFPVAEMAKLHQRLAALSANNTPPAKPANNSPASRLQVNTNENVTSAPNPVNSRVFGAEMFTTSSLTFQPDLKNSDPDEL